MRPIDLYDKAMEMHVPANDIGHFYYDLFLRKTELTESFVEPFRKENPGEIGAPVNVNGNYWYVIYYAYRPHYDRVKVDVEYRRSLPWREDTSWFGAGHLNYFEDIERR